jgi:hypothetical protein
LHTTCLPPFEDASAISGQELCNSCSCAIFNGLFDALAFAGHSVTSVDGSISNCAENLWQGLLDANALPQETQTFLASCKPGDCVYSAATSAVVAMDVDYQAPNCPLSVKQFASSVPLRQAVVTACGELGGCDMSVCYITQQYRGAYPLLLTWQHLHPAKQDHFIFNVCSTDV